MFFFIAWNAFRIFMSFPIRIPIWRSLRCCVSCRVATLSRNCWQSTQKTHAIHANRDNCSVVMHQKWISIGHVQRICRYNLHGPLDDVGDMLWILWMLSNINIICWICISSTNKDVLGNQCQEWRRRYGGRSSSKQQGGTNEWSHGVRCRWHGMGPHCLRVVVVSEQCWWIAKKTSIFVEQDREIATKLLVDTSTLVQHI